MNSSADGICKVVNGCPIHVLYIYAFEVMKTQICSAAVLNTVSDLK